MDIVSSEQRSKNMAAIHSRNTKPEIYFRKLLFSRGYRYRLNCREIFGHPDIYLSKYNTAIFVHGCYWHRHKNCKYAYMPKSNVDFWTKKFQDNVHRDIVVKHELDKKGIKCLVIWECTVKRMKKDKRYCQHCMDEVEKFLQDDTQYYSL